MEIPPHVLRIANDRDFKVTIRIGRSGLTESFFSELEAQLKSRKVVKIKMNKGLTESQSERKEMFSHIGERVNATLVKSRGNVAIYWKT
jgi:RNA-binding protein YhbY